MCRQPCSAVFMHPQNYLHSFHFFFSSNQHLHALLLYACLDMQPEQLERNDTTPLCRSHESLPRPTSPSSPPLAPIRQPLSFSPLAMRLRARSSMLSSKPSTPSIFLYVNPAPLSLNALLNFVPSFCVLMPCFIHVQLASKKSTPIRPCTLVSMPAIRPYSLPSCSSKPLPSSAYTSPASWHTAELIITRKTDRKRGMERG